MASIRIISIGILLLTNSCKQDNTKDKLNVRPVVQEPASSDSTLIFRPDTSYQYVYDFMKVVMYDQQLNVNFGVRPEPEASCALHEEDSVYLSTLLFKKQKKAEVDTGGLITIELAIPKNLTKSERNEMLVEKQKQAALNWNGERLGFNGTNKDYSYGFSRVLFSKNRKKAVMMIRILCGGLCGSGYTVFFAKEKDKWVSHKGGHWIH